MVAEIGRAGKFKRSMHRGMLLKSLAVLGFEVCPFVSQTNGIKLSDIEKNIQTLKNRAEKERLPIDGIVLRYNSISYSRTLGRTGHYYKDGIAFKFEDDTYETVFRSIEWETSRSGVISPVAIFDPVVIDGCKVSRASLHNLSFIKDLELHSGCRILVSKRNMIIPHIEENLDRKFDMGLIPKKCPCCGSPTRIFSRANNGKMIETLHCDNPDCRNQEVRKFVHFASKKAMNIEGISKATIEKLVERGYLKSFADFYNLARYRRGIIEMAGFGEKAYWNIYQAVEKSRKTTFVRYLVAMDIPMVGRTASRVLDNYFGGDLQKFAKAATENFDFTVLPDFGATLSRNIHDWFSNADNLELWNTLQKELKFERKEETMKNTSKNNPFMDTFVQIVPFGDFCKKDEAVSLIHRNIQNMKLCRRMLRLVDLIPEKKSLLLAQKALNCRGIDNVMDGFARIGVSPVTLSKRQEVKRLGNLYSYLA